MNPNDNPYPLWYQWFYIVHPPTVTKPVWSLELDISRVSGVVALLFVGYVVVALGSGAWAPAIPVAVAILSLLAGLVATVYLSSLSLDKERILANAKLPGSIAHAVSDAMTIPLDREPGIDEGDLRDHSWE